MTPEDIKLLLIALGSIVFLVTLIVSRLRTHPFIALLITAVGVGFCAGIPAEALTKSITDGAGHTLGTAGIVVVLGAMLGKVLADGGVTQTIADKLTANTSLRMLPWTITFIAFVIGIPMFFEVGLVILLPLLFSVARNIEEHQRFKGSAYVYVGVPAISALCAMHGMVPPHPGPLTAIASLDTSIGATMVYGFIAAVPSMILGGPLYGLLLAPNMSVRPDATVIAQYSGRADTPANISLITCFLTALMPALLMLLHTLAELLTDGNSAILKTTAFIGSPVMAMLIGLIFAAIMLVYVPRRATAELRASLTESIKPIGNVIMIIAGGGAFQHVLKDASVGQAIMHMSDSLSLSPLLLGWIVAMLLSVSTGSATVGIVGAAGLLAPFAGNPHVNAPLLALSIGCGSLFFNYANHAGFWFVKESFGMSMKEATMTITVIQSVVSLAGLLMVLLMNLFPPLV